MSTRLGLLGALAWVLGGCSGDSANDSAAAAQGSGASSASGSGAGGSGGASGETYTVTFDPINVTPGSENTQCVTKRLTNAAPIKVPRIDNVLATGSHHLIVYRTNDTEEAPEPQNCQPFVDTLDPSKGSPLMITQKSEETLTLPDGVGFVLEAQQMVRLEMHYLNASAADLQVSATSTFHVMPDAEFTDAADFLFIGNPDIDIPPNSAFTLGPTFFALKPDLQASKFFGITGHTHQWGTNVRVATAPSESGPDTAVYDVPGWLWDEPETVSHDPPFTLPEGGGFRFTCEYQNGSSSPVGFGESANAEMCFFWAYYYPSQGAYVCAHTDQVPGGYDICCPGDGFCDQLF